MILEPLLSIEQVAAILGISPWTLRKHLAKGHLASVHVGRRVLIEPQAVRDFIKHGRSADLVQEPVAA
jgi:excisionase family DNA binding protein